ncbi:hypothetical protein M422DRAFT_264007 [Sphaerobolus stellatus SS14]|uniref:Uncharacterized protein n=1 Tax=Sphaerobolus stellatus (strain SS14) TaxID=990650 RepID=A0A0C9UXM6_SPHS4|nr:hypothetical protein M422DRAFT_264007 [Sphaerobolus stellatus SS14]
MSTCHSCKRVEESSVPAVGDNEPPQGLTAGELMNTPQPSVDPQQTAKVFTQEHLGDQNMRAHGPQTVPIWVQSPIGVAATPGQDSPQGIISGSDSGHNLGGAPDKSDHISPDEGGTENEDSSFTIQASEVGRLCKEYAELTNLKENGEIVLAEAMEATKRLNTVFNHIRTSMNGMFPMMKELLILPKRKSSGKTIEPRNNWARDKAVAKAATE